MQTNGPRRCFRPEGFRGSGFLSLVHRYDSTRIDQACEIALTHNAFRLKTIRGLIQRGGPKQQELEFIDEHPIIRSLSDYEAIVRTSLR